MKSRIKREPGRISGKWYSKYTGVFEKPYGNISEDVFETISHNFSGFSCEDPVASVVIIAHNEESRLTACLWSLSDNSCPYPVEFIGIDNNSSDRTGEIFIRAGVKSFFESRQSSGYARLCGLEHAVGRYYIGIDADTMYPPYYIQTVIEKLQRPGIVAVSSLWSFIPDKKRPAASLAFYEFLRDIHLRMLFIRRPELVVRGMVFSYVIAAGRKTGYRVDLLRGGDDGIMALGLKKDGKIKLLTCRKTRVTTSSGTLSADGSLWKSFLVRFSKVLSGFGKYFTKRSHYEDDESNMINKKDGNI